jgi:DNA-directed RNA polymerase subunit M/transcription elongation factor TFIIS
MKFCPNCRNMLYGIEEDVVDGDKTAVLACRKCEYKEALTRENPVVYEHILKQDTSDTLILNPYLKYDPTLEHLTNIICPNTLCPTKTTDVKPDIVAVELNEKKLVWMYQCANCDYAWKQNGRAS